MAVESADDRAVFFNADEFGKAASYTPPGGGAAVACTVLLDRADQDAKPDSGQPLAGQYTLQVRRSEIAAPAKAGSFVIDGVTYDIQNRPWADDMDRLIWTMWVYSL